MSFTVSSEPEVGLQTIMVSGSVGTEQFHAMPVNVFFERADAPTQLKLEDPFSFQHPGYDLPTSLTATFADGVELQVRESSLVTFTTSDPNVALVGRYGEVSAIGAGTATITATYQSSPKPLVATTQVRVDQAFLVPTPPTLQFGSHALGTSETRTVTLTNRHQFTSIAVKSLSVVRDYAVTSDCLPTVPLAPGASCSATVTHTPTRSGQNRSVLKVQTSFGGIPEGVPLFGEGAGLRASATSLSGSPNPSVLGQPITLTATVVDGTGGGPPTPTGSAVFSSGSTTLATVPLTGAGTASTSVSTLGVGSHALTASYGGDGSYGPSSSAPLAQLVRYAPAGPGCGGGPGRQILQPVNADGTSVFNQRRTVPAKFRVCNTAGQSIGTPGVVQDFRLTQVISGTTSDVNETVPSTTPDTAFRWDATDQLWIFNISTSGQQAQQTYVYTITLNDGTTISFRYGLR